MSRREQLIEDIENLQDIISALSSKIKQSGVNWKDEKFYELSKQIANVANMSKKVYIANSSCERAIKRFESVENIKV